MIPVILGLLSMIGTFAIVAIAVLVVCRINEGRWMWQWDGTLWVSCPICRKRKLIILREIIALEKSERINGSVCEDCGADFAEVIVNRARPYFERVRQLRLSVREYNSR